MWLAALAPTTIIVDCRRRHLRQGYIRIFLVYETAKVWAIITCISQHRSANFYRRNCTILFVCHGRISAGSGISVCSVYLYDSCIKPHRRISIRHLCPTVWFSFAIWRRHLLRTCMTTILSLIANFSGRLRSDRSEILLCPAELWHGEGVSVWRHIKDLHRHGLVASGHAVVRALLWHDRRRHRPLLHLRVSCRELVCVCG